MHFAPTTMAFILSLKHMKLLLASELLQLLVHLPGVDIPQIFFMIQVLAQMSPSQTFLITLSKIHFHLTPVHIILLYFLPSIYFLPELMVFVCFLPLPSEGTLH